MMDTPSLEEQRAIARAARENVYALMQPAGVLRPHPAEPRPAVLRAAIWGICYGAFIVCGALLSWRLWLWAPFAGFAAATVTVKIALAAWRG